MNSEHVEVLRHMKETIKAIAPSEVAALDAAIASLSAPPPPARIASIPESSPNGWLQAGGLLYRLTEEDWPQNIDEINVTMVHGSRDPAHCEARAAEILAMLQSQQQPPAEAQPVGEAGAMPGSNGGFTAAVFKASDVPEGTKLYTAPPSAPVGVEGLVAKWREQVNGMEGTWDDKSPDGYREATEDCANELEAFAQQPTPVAPVGVEAIKSAIAELDALRNAMFKTYAAAANGADKTKLTRLIEAERDAYESHYSLPKLQEALAQEPAACVGCEGNPAPENNPCAVCGQQPAAVDEAMVGRACEAFLASTGQSHPVTQLQKELTAECMRPALTAALAGWQGEQP